MRSVKEIMDEMAARGALLKPAPGVEPEAHRRLGMLLAEKGLIDPVLVPERRYSEAEVREALDGAYNAVGGETFLAFAHDVLRRLRGEGEELTCARCGAKGPFDAAGAYLPCGHTEAVEES